MLKRVYGVLEYLIPQLVVLFMGEVSNVFDCAHSYQQVSDARGQVEVIEEIADDILLPHYEAEYLYLLILIRLTGITCSGALRSQKDTTLLK